MKNLLTKLSITNKLKTINYLLLSLLFTITTLIPLTTSTANATPLPTDVPEHAWTVGTNDGRFQYPYGITTDSSGNVYVADTGNNRIQKFNSSGTFLAKWGANGSADGEFNTPAGITTDSSGNVYVTDTNNHRIQKFNSSGTFLAKWGTSGSGDGEFDRPYDITTDSSGNVYVVEMYNHRIQKFDSNGTFLAKWGTLGSADGEFIIMYGAGLHIDNFDNLYVSEFLNSRIQKFAYPSEEPETPEESSSDSDGIPDTIENSAPNSGDANNDGIADSTQANVTSYLNPVTTSYSVLEVPTSCSITSVSSQSEDSNTVKDPAYTYPAGLMNFTIDCGTSGFSANIVQYHYTNTSLTNLILRKYNPNTNAYFTITNASLTAQSIGGQSVIVSTYQVTDGSELDIDNTANGIIVDPAGLASQAIGAPNTGL